MIISHFGICLGIVQNVFLLNWDILIISQYYMYVIKFRSTSQIIHLFYLFHVSFDCVYWFSWYPGWYSYATTQNDINMRMIRLELGKTFVYLLHQWPILFFWVRYWKISFLGYAISWWNIFAYVSLFSREEDVTRFLIEIILSFMALSVFIF